MRDNNTLNNKESNKTKQSVTPLPRATKKTHQNIASENGVANNNKKRKTQEHSTKKQQRM